LFAREQLGFFAAGGYSVADIGEMNDPDEPILIWIAAVSFIFWCVVLGFVLWMR
jgi:hypothetical protein